MMQLNEVVGFIPACFICSGGVYPRLQGAEYLKYRSFLVVTSWQLMEIKGGI
jgi:hypothetical protein